MELRPVQAVALYEAALMNGLFAPLRVGSGKTIVSLLVAVTMNAKRPVLIVPAKLVDKTQRAARALSIHWQIPNFIRIVSYELLGRVQSAELLTRYQPDLVILDECHRAKNLKAAVTRRIVRYLAENRAARLVSMSGTITKRSLKDYAHLLRRALGAEKAPVPLSTTELEDWAGALDEKPTNENRFDTGALVLMCSPEEAALHATDPLQACRKAFRRRLSDTQGIVATLEAKLACSLSIQAIQPKMNANTEEAFHKMRTDDELPDGQPLVDGLATWRHARELALGFFYLWEPAAPPEWMKRRKAWYKMCRTILTDNHRNLDSELAVVNAVIAGLYPYASFVYNAWREVRDSFKPKTVPVWFDDGAIDAAVSWSKGGPGIIWTEHTAFAERLSQVSGLPYYGKEGRDSKGRPIPEFGEPGCGEGVVIASTAANAEGRNLQAWYRNLVVSPPPNGLLWEQMLGRTHRDGQEADEVSFEMFVTCKEHLDAFERSRSDAKYIEHTQGQPQKILYADVDVSLNRYQLR